MGTKKNLKERKQEQRKKENGKKTGPERKKTGTKPY